MDLGTVQQIDIDREMREAYLDYAMSVIVSRALPDARDGLKPVHRRILFAMYDMGLRPDSPYRKSARIVGEVLGKYHPHGDMAVYEAMVRMAQDFAMRYPLVDGQGNFGSIDGDAAAAMRYTEARMLPAGFDLMMDIDKETVDLAENFDGSLWEPSVLPASIPNLLVNGSSGIAVGMSTSIPPHNLGEVCDALIFMLDNWTQLEDIGLPDLMRFIKGPDFPTGGLVFRYSDGGETDCLAQAYGTGRAKLVVQVKVHVEELDRNRNRIIVTELPYQVNKTTMIERIAELVRDKRIEGITDLRDESDRQGLRVVIDLTRTVDPYETLDLLYKLTPMRTTFSIIMLALVDGEPRLLSMKHALRVYLEHRFEVVRRRSEYDLERARERAHILEGYLTALDNLDEVIDLIRRSRTVDTARENLRRRFKLSEVQAQAILDMPLRRLAALERKKIEDEYKEKRELIQYLERLLGDAQLLRDAVKQELVDVKNHYTDRRRTTIVEGSKASAATVAELLPAEMSWVVLTESGLLSRSLDDEQPNITGGISDPPRLMLAARASDILYLFTSDGMAASLPVHQLAQVGSFEEGTHFASSTSLGQEHKIVAALTLPQGVREGYLFLTSVSGMVKRVAVEDLPGISAHEFQVMIVGDDALGWAAWTGGSDEVVLVSAGGLAIRFSEDDVRPMGLRAGGVKGMKLADDADQVVAMAVADVKTSLWVITNSGFAKSSPLVDYPIQGRYGQGVIAIKFKNKQDRLVGAALGLADDGLVVVTSRGKPRHMRLGAAPSAGRNTSGEVIVPLGVGEQVAHIVVPGYFREPDAEQSSEA
jgi:DNA gyrase subunit A